MIMGIGNDVVEIERIREALDRHGRRFLHRVLSEDERFDAQNFSSKRLNEYVAGRFSAKEALAKATGFGLAKLAMPSVTIQLGQRGLVVRWTGESALMAMGEQDHLHLSISHNNEVAFAVAVWEREA